MLIDDGQGGGNVAGVTDENRLKTVGVSTSTEHHANHEHGRAYTIQLEQTPSAGDDCIFYMKNTDDIDMCVEGVTLYVGAACEVYFQIGDTGTRNSATDITPTNLNGGSGNSADGDFEYGADLDGGAATLAGGTEFFRVKFIAETASTNVNFEQDVVLPKNATLTMWNDTNTNTMATFDINYHDIDAG